MAGPPELRTEGSLELALTSARTGRQDTHSIGLWEAMSLIKHCTLNGGKPTTSLGGGAENVCL